MANGSLKFERVEAKISLSFIKNGNEYFLEIVDNKSVSFHVKNLSTGTKWDMDSRDYKIFKEYINSNNSFQLASINKNLDKLYSINLKEKLRKSDIKKIHDIFLRSTAINEKYYKLNKKTEKLHKKGNSYLDADEAVGLFEANDVIGVLFMLFQLVRSYFVSYGIVKLVTMILAATIGFTGVLSSTFLALGLVIFALPYLLVHFQDSMILYNLGVAPLTTIFCKVTELEAYINRLRHKHKKDKLMKYEKELEKNKDYENIKYMLTEKYSVTLSNQNEAQKYINPEEEKVTSEEKAEQKKIDVEKKKESNPEKEEENNKVLSSNSIVLDEEEKILEETKDISYKRR